MPAGVDSSRLPREPGVVLNTFSPIPPTPADEEDRRYTREARFSKRLPDRRVECDLCPRTCVLRPGQRGYCGARENRGGALVTMVYGRVCSWHVDPIEKKPLFHYLPGSTAFSIATVGCNVHCRFCQNWELSQARPEESSAEPIPPGQVAELARQFHCPSIAYTYTEPTVFAEYAMDAADAGHAVGVRSIVVSNGYIQHDALTEAWGRIDAVKIDLKSMSESFYAKVVGGELKPVLDALLTLRAMNKWMEVVYLVLPTLNDSDAELRSLARWMKTNLGADVPLHFTQFHPDYLFKNLPVTPLDTLERARAIASAEGLHYVYIGNVPGHPAQNTFCPGCGELLVERVGFTASRMLIRKDGMCPHCARAIAGIWHV